MTLKGIIFDLDGTLADTLPLCIGAFQETMRHFTGQALAPAEISAYFGPTEEGVLEKLLPGRLGESLPRYLAEYERLHDQCGYLFPGVEQALDLLKSRRIRMAIVTGKGQHSAEIDRRILGLERWIDCVETGFADRADKPVQIRKVLEHWGIPPQEAAYLGDVPSDMQAARQVGVLPLGAAWAGTSKLRKAADGLAEITFYDMEGFINWIEKI